MIHRIITILNLYDFCMLLIKLCSEKKSETGLQHPFYSYLVFHHILDITIQQRSILWILHVTNLITLRLPKFSGMEHPSPELKNKTSLRK